MASRTKKQRQQQGVIEQMIYNGYRRGVCDMEGRSVKGSDGRYVRRPRFRRHSSVVRRIM